MLPYVTMCQNDNFTDLTCVAHSSQISRQNGRNMFVKGREVNLSHEKCLLGTLKKHTPGEAKCVKYVWRSWRG